jgi:hypothetical protein
VLASQVEHGLQTHTAIQVAVQIYHRDAGMIHGYPSSDQQHLAIIAAPGAFVKKWVDRIA